MMDHYALQVKEGLAFNRKQIMMIWTFKRKRHPDESLDKYKA